MSQFVCNGADDGFLRHASCKQAVGELAQNGVMTSRYHAGVIAGFGAVGLGLAAAYQDEPHKSVDERFQGRFQLVSVDTGKPIVGKEVRVRSTTGQYLTGTTDAEGFTQWVERDAAESLALDLLEPSA